MIRRISVLGLVAVLAVIAPAGAQASTVGAGTATTTLDLAELTASGLPVRGVNLGGLTSYASTLPDSNLNVLGRGEPFALSVVRLPIGGELAARSDGNTGRPGQTVDLGLGTLTIGDLLAVVEGARARSAVNALTGTVDAGLAGLRVAGTGANSVVSTTDATATNGAILHDLSIDLTDILPLDLLDKLPLDVLLGLIDGLGIELDVPGTVTTTARQARELIDGLEAVKALQETIDATQTALTSAGAKLAGEQAKLTQLTDQLTEQSSLVSSACEVKLPGGLDLDGSVVDDLIDTGTGLIDTVLDPDIPLPGGSLGGGGIIGTLPFDHSPCHDLQQTVDQALDVEATIAALNKLIDDLQDTLNEGVEVLDDVLDKLLKLLEGLDLSRLTDLLDALVDGLAGTELLKIDRLAVGVTSFADADGSSASVLCELRGLAVLGQQLGNTCDTLQVALESVGRRIEDLLAGLPIVGTVTPAAVGLPGDVVTLAQPRLHSTEDNQRDGDYYVSAAQVEGLRLGVASLELTQVADDLLADLLAQVDALLEEVAGLTGITVDLALLDAALDEILAVVGSLPTGDLLAGVKTPALNLAALDLNSNSRFAAAGTGIVPVTPGGPGATPGQPPTSPAPKGDLPTTGGGLAAALLLLIGGGAISWWLRRRPSPTGI